MERFEHGGDLYGKPGVFLDFSVNINPLGLPDEARRALVARVDEFVRYPDPKCRALGAALAARENVPEQWILCGNGAADLIYRLCYAIKPRETLVCAPSFSEYERAAAASGGRIACHFLREENGFALTDEILLRLVPGLDLLFLCHPNNPTGRLIPEKLLERILYAARQNNTIVVVDECFLDFSAGSSAARYLREIPGLVVLKAFTKFYAMAGLRLGYLMTGEQSLRDRIEASAQCWNVSVPAQIAGIAALTCIDWADRTRSLVTRERDFLSDSLRALGIKVYPGDANFLLLRSGRPLYQPLLEKGILIRRCENFKALEDGSYSRIGIKTRAENEILLRAIKEVLHA